MSRSESAEEVKPSDRCNVAILYPREWFGDEDGFDAAVRQIEAIDPTIVTHVLPYVEEHSVRTMRSTGVSIPKNQSPPPLTDEQADLFEELDVAVAIDLPAHVQRYAPRLAWVQAIGAGTGQLQDALSGANGIVLTGNGGANGVAIAEFVMGRIIEWSKQFRRLAEQATRHDWSPLYGNQLAGKTVCLIGFGGINQAIATRAIAFEMDVVVVRRSSELPTGVRRTFPPERLHEALGLADIVVAAVPETPLTTDMMNADAFASMRSGAFFVNVGRGTLVDERALSAALERGHLAGAALDVTRAEPLDREDPLWDVANLVISPHCSAAPNAMFVNVHRLFTENLRRFLDGKPLMHEISFTRGY